MDRRQKGTIDIIKFFIKEKQIAVISDKAVFAIDRKGDDYLLGQILRQVWLPKENYYVSTKAMAKWEELGHKKGDIFDVFYQFIVKSNVDVPIAVSRYKGAEKNPWNYNEEKKYLNPNDNFHYREVFHDDHITTIQFIKNKLYELEVIDDENILNILKTIKIAKILKEEDKKILRLKKDLPQELTDERIKEYYAKKEVVLKSYQEWCD